MTQFHIKIPFHILLLLYYSTICNKNVVVHLVPWVNTYGFLLLLLFNVGAAIPDNNVTLAECQLYHFSSSPPFPMLAKKCYYCMNCKIYHLQSVTKMLTPVQCWCYGVSFAIQTIIALFNIH